MINQQQKKTIISVLLIALLAVIGFFYLKPTHTASHEEGQTEETFTRGPHRGRLLENGAFQVEVTIYEPAGVPPKFRIYFYKNGTPINPSDVSFEMELHRINRVEKIPFQQHREFLESTVEALEPHSFKVMIRAEFEGKKSNWEYETYEGRVELTQEAIVANHIKIDEAEPVNLEMKLEVMGKVTPNEERTFFISPRFPGIVKAVHKKLGDHVTKGEVLAVIESNESLRNYEIKSESNGMVIKRNINLGIYLTGQENIFVISDLSSVWADFNVSRHDLSKVNLGDPITITSLDGKNCQQTTISYISPVGHENTQSVTVRAVLSNPEEFWKPGLFISGDITVEKIPVAVAIKDKALQTYRGWNVVFIAVGHEFEVAPVELGRQDKEWVEITSGLSAGDCYVSDNSFILKADLEKSSAVHEH